MIGITSSRNVIAAVFFVSTIGCCCDEWCRLPDDCADAIGCTQLGWELGDVCCGSCPAPRCVDCGTVDCGCEIGGCPAESCFASRKPCVEPGPPPVRYVPPMPPKFLAVPARPVFTGVNMDGPSVAHSQIDIGHGPQISFPARD